MKTWHVVKFTNENSVEVVPSTWYLKQTSECFWPPPLYRKDKIVKLIEHCVDAMQEWEIFRVKLLGTYDSFEVANKKAARATVTSDLSTNSDKLLSSKRKRRKNPKFLESDSDSPSSEDDNSYPNLRKSAISTRRSRSYSPDAEKQSVDTSTLFYSEDNLCIKAAATSGIEHISEIESAFDKVEKNPSSTGLVTNGNIQNNKYEVNPSSRNETIGAFINDNDFKKLVISELSSIQLKLQHMMSEVSVLVQLQRQPSTCTKSEYSLKLNTLNSKCPLTTIEDLRKFEEWIEDEENYRITVTEFQRIGGQNYAQTTRKIMYKMISNEVAIMFSWDGLKKKASFKCLKLAKAILEAMKIQFMEVSESNIVDVIKTFLVKAKERINLGDKKKIKALANEKEKN